MKALNTNEMVKTRIPTGKVDFNSKQQLRESEGIMDRKVKLPAELKSDLDAFFYDYSTRKDTTQGQALQVLKYMFYNLNALIDTDNFDFEYESQQLNILEDTYTEKIQALRDKQALAKFFDVLDNFFQSVTKNEFVVDNIADGILKEYIKTL